MNRHARIYLSLGIIFAVGLLILLWSVRETDSLASHLRLYEFARRLHQAKSGPMKVFSREYVRWTLNGRPSLEALNKERQRHEEELVRLGYFERREFVLKDLDLDGQARARLARMISGGAFTNNWRMIRMSPQESLLRVTACPGDLKVVDRIIAEFRTGESENARWVNPNPGR